MNIYQILKHNCIQKDGIYLSKIDGSQLTGDLKAIKFLEKYQITEGIQSVEGIDYSCLGFCPRRQKWYGWSSKDICGFGVGSVISPNSFLYRGFPEVLNTLEDAKKMAGKFAKYVLTF